MYYALLALSVVLTVFQFSFTKIFQLRTRSGRVEAFLFSALAGGITALLFFCVNGFKLTVSAYTLVMSLVLALLICLLVILGLFAVSYGRVSLYTMFVMLGATLVPFVYGIAFLGEAFTAGKAAGSLVLIAALVLPALEGRGERMRSPGKFFLLCTLLFLVNGAICIVSKAHQIDVRAAGTFDFLVLGYAFTGLFSLIGLGVYLLLRKRTGAPSGIPEAAVPAKAAYGRRELLLCLLIIVGYAVVNGGSYLLQLVSARELPASVLYPIVSGGSVALSAAAGRLFFREKLTKASVAAIVLAVASTVLFVF